MFFRAGALSMVLLLLSRVLGLVRESAQAATFGASLEGDLTVLMLSLPDWLTGVAISGALAYGLVPHWSLQTTSQRNAGQRQIAGVLLGLGIVVGLTMVALGTWGTAWLLPGLSGEPLSHAEQALRWSWAALPLAMLAALWTTRLQFEEDFVGVYAANLLINLILIASLSAVAWRLWPTSALLGAGLMGAMLVRLTWLAWRQALARRARLFQDFGPTTVVFPQDSDVPTAGTAGPSWHIWLVSALAAGLPLALPFVARTLTSASGVGHLALFNYAWKLVELPLVLAIQLVAALALPAISKAMADDQRQRGAVPDSARVAARAAFALAWVLGCAAVVGLQLAAPVAVTWMFGWGKMTPESLDTVAAWARTASWGLLPQALSAVSLAVLAAQRRMLPIVGAYVAGLLALLLAGYGGVQSGETLMTALNAVVLAVSLVSLLQLGQGRVPYAWLPWPALAVGGAVTALASAVATWPLHGAVAQIGATLLGLGLLFGLAAWLSPDLRTSLRR